MENIVKPSILPGFMELLPAEQAEFNNIIDTIKAVYESYGFISIDTPVIEKAEVLFAKGGGETEKQIYKIENDKTPQALRFDLTVPLARYVAQHYSDLDFPFRRYQISKVYRGERNQKGRFREFYQSDIDIIGNGSLSIANDAELVKIISEIFERLNFSDFVIRINNRKVLNGLFDFYNIEDKTLVLRVIDKIEKVGREAVCKELSELGIQVQTIESIIDFITFKGEVDAVISYLKGLDIKNETYSLGVYELEQVCKHIGYYKVNTKNFRIDLSIARGLDYYTGTVYETFLNDYPEIGSVCSGGRYDNLAEYYTKQQLPGVGISIGLTRLFYQLEQLGLTRGAKACSVEYMILPMEESCMEFALKVAERFRCKGKKVQVYFEGGKFKRMLNYANKLNAPYAVIIGSEEAENQQITVKDFVTGEQKKLSIDEL